MTCPAKTKAMNENPTRLKLLTFLKFYYDAVANVIHMNMLWTMKKTQKQQQLRRKTNLKPHKPLK